MNEQPKFTVATAIARQPQRQVEVQLGHLCNNRCVFCVSGQLSEQRRAPQLLLEPILRQLAVARAEGATRITLLGGEPTIQRGFLEVLRFAVDQQFDEIVVFTNGVMTPRETFRNRVFAVLEDLGADAQKRVIWRFSLQGGNRSDHDATTLVNGSWDRIVDSLAILRQRGARLTGNMCVVESNYRHGADLAVVAADNGLENLHLDMVRPRDSGDRTDDELRAMLARYTDMAPHFNSLMDQADALLGPNWDLNFGNVPYCTNLRVAHRIHHDGQDTVTVAADGQGNTQEGFNKYEDKRVDKHKPLSCADCVFDAKCSGIFDKYRQFYGDSEFVPVTATALWQIDTLGHHFGLLALPQLRQLAQKGSLQIGRTDERAGEIDVVSEGWTLTLRRLGRPISRAGWHTLNATRFAADVLVAPAPGHASERAIVQLWRRLRATLDEPNGTAGNDEAQLLALRAGWRRQIQQAGQRGAEVDYRRAVARCADSLRHAAIAGFALADSAVAADGSVQLTFRCGAAEVMLTVSAGQDPRGVWRPRLAHAAAGVDAATLNHFNRELGETLRGARCPTAASSQV